MFLGVCMYKGGKNTLICQKLNLDPVEVTRRCSRPHGNPLSWLLREVLYLEGHRLSKIQKEHLINFFLHSLRSTKQLCESKYEAWYKRQLIYPDAQVDAVMLMHNKYNPFVYLDKSVNYVEEDK